MSSSSTSLSSSSSPSSLHATKVLLACLILNTCMPFSCGSAIPIWEFLSRNEKMSYLYSTFAQLVSIHCKATFTASPFLPPVNQCKHNLLSYGYDKLQTFSDHQLDTLDPYQRGANKLIWSSIMRDHPSAQLITTRKPLPTPPISSIIILTHQQKVTNNGAREQQQPQQLLLQTSTSSSNILNMTPKIDDHRFNKNPMFDHDTKHQQQYSMDMDMAYGYPSLKTQDNVIDKSFQEHQKQKQQQQQQQHQHQHHEHQNRNHQPQELFDTTSTTTTDNNQQQHSQHYHDYQYGKNPMFEADAERLHQYAMDMDAAYGHIFSPKQTQQLISHTREQQQQQQQQHQHPIFLTGPSVIRVRPDGTPVEEDRHKPLPRDDDDFEDYYVSHATSSSYDSSRNNNNNNNVKPAQSSKQHKKIATISALIQQQLGALAQEAKEEEEEEEQKQRDQIQSQRHQYNNPVSQPPMALHNDYHSSIKN